MAQADVLFRIEAQMGDTLAQLRKLEEQIDSLPPKQKAVAGATDATADSMRGLVSALGPVAGAIAGAFSVGAIVSFGRASVMAAAESEDSINRLRIALNTQGAATQNNVDYLSRMAGALQDTTRYSDDAIMKMQAMALAIGLPAERADDFTRAAVDMAAALQMDVVDAGDQLAKTLDGDAGRLKQLIPDLGNLSKAALQSGDAIDLVGKKFRGAAEQDAKSLGGSLDMLKNQWDEMKEAFGRGLQGDGSVSSTFSALSDLMRSLVPLIEAAAVKLRGLAEIATQVSNAIGELVAQDTNALAGTNAGKVIESRNAITQIEAEIAAVEKKREAYVSGEGTIIKWMGETEKARHRASMESSAQAKAYDHELDMLKAGLQDARKAFADARAEVMQFGNGTKAAMEAGSVGVAKLAGEVDKALQNKLREFAEASGQIAKQFDVGLQLADTDEKRVALAERMRSELKSATEAGMQLVGAGNLSQEAFAATAAEIEKVGDAITAATAEAARAQILREFDLKHDAMDPEKLAASQVLNAQDMAAGEGDAVTEDVSAMVSAQRVAANEAEAQSIIALMETTGSYEAAKAEYAAQRDSEIALQNAVIAGNQAEADAILRKQRAVQQTIRLEQQHYQMKMQMRQATLASAQALMQEAMAGQLTARSLLKAGLEYLAQWAGKKSIASFASAAEQMAIYTASHGADGAALAAAQQFTHTGTMWGVLAAGAGAAAGAAGAGGKGGSGGGGGGKGTGGAVDGEFGGATQRDNSRTVDATRSGEQRGPSVQVVFSGNVTSAGGPQEFARIIKSELDRVASETGGRSATVRL